VNADSSKARSSLRSRVRAQVNDAILDAAEALIAERGLHHVPLTAIARRAGVAVGTLYNYHADRDALVRALFASRRAVVLPLIRAAGADARELAFEPRLRHYVAAVLAVFDANRPFLRVAFETEHLRRPPPGTKPTMTEHAAELEQIVAAGVTAGELAPAHAELATRALLGSIRATIQLRLEQDRPAAPDADALVDLFLDGARVR